MCPSSGELTVAGMVGMRLMSLIPTSRPDSHPYKSEKYQCRIDTVSSPDDGHIVARNM